MSLKFPIDLGSISRLPEFLRGRGSSARLWIIGASFFVLLHALMVLWIVASSRDIGLRCVFGTIQEDSISPHYRWRSVEESGRVPVYPTKGAEFQRFEAIDQSWAIEVRPGDFTAIVRAQRSIASMPLGAEVRVEWNEPQSTGADPPEVHEAIASASQREFSTYAWSILWFFIEMVIFAIGANVYWRRPLDRSAQIFFWLCVVTVTAFIGGYHWSEVIIFRLLIFLFPLTAMLVPIVSLHFYLVFPRPNPVILLYPKLLWVLYGVMGIWLVGVWGCMIWLSIDVDASVLTGAMVPDRVATQGLLEGLTLGYIRYSVLIFLLCIVCLAYSFIRARNREERSQVLWILVASVVSLGLITYLMLLIRQNVASLGLDGAAWPMYVVSLLFTVAYAMSITRYRLSDAEAVFRRSLRYLIISVGISLLYSVLLVGVGFFAGRALLEKGTSGNVTIVAMTALISLALSGAIRRRVDQAIDRRFFREKYKFDSAMRKMSDAVDRLVDRDTIGARLLDAAAEVLGLDWGAIYVRRSSERELGCLASLGPEPDQRTLGMEDPLSLRLSRDATYRVPGAIGRGSSDPVADSLISRGGEVAAALLLDGELAGVLVLGPKRSGLPYDDEEMVFLGALSSVSALALRSATIHQTLDELNDELRAKVDKIAEQQRRIMVLQDQLAGNQSASNLELNVEDRDHDRVVEEPAALKRIRGSSAPIQEMITIVRKAASSNSSVLILGESGTGKELVAEAVHAASPRSHGPFVKVHCAALAPGVLESELFGHLRGSFTGADRDRTGRFQQADGGTLLLDEIGDVSLEVQTKLLRVLQTRTFERVGSSQPETVDVRILAATHRDLPALIRAGKFREDLYYRLNVISIRTPALRERPEDIFELAVVFLRRFADETRKSVTQLDEEAIEVLSHYHWPGNVRELENVIERSVVLADGPAIKVDDLPPELLEKRILEAKKVGEGAFPSFSERGGRGRPRRLRPQTARDQSPKIIKNDSELERYERHRLIDALNEANGNKAEAARLLGIPRSTLISKLKRQGLMDSNASTRSPEKENTKRK